MFAKYNKYEYFNDFVISRCNQVAAKKCFDMAIKLHNKGCILFVQGYSPCGKTHLLNTTAKIYKEKFNSDAIVVSFCQMIDDYTKAIKDKNIESFYNKYVNDKLLLIDDTQCIVGKSSVQDAFVRIFKNFIGRGINIVLFSEYKIGCYDELKNGLYGQSYFSVVDIHKADLILRKKLLSTVLYKEKVNISNKIFAFIVFNKKIEISSIKGCVLKIKLMRAVKGNMLDDKEIINVLKEYER